MVAATGVDQLDYPTPATRSGMRAHMDPAVSPGRTDVVSGARPKVVPHGLMCVFHMRAGGHLNRSPASKCAQSAWIARGASDRARVGRAGGLPRALCSHHPSDLGLAQAGGLHVTGPAPARPQFTHASSPPSERSAPTRLHPWALSGGLGVPSSS